jgi:phage terminase large subunit-like protein
LKNKHRRRKEQLEKWISQGYITLVPGESHNYDRIRDSIMEDIERFKIRMIGYDQFQAPSVINHIESKSSVQAIKIPQTTTRMHAGSKELMRVLGQRQLTTNKNPVMRWMARSTVPKIDHEGYVKPYKEASRLPIDGITALVDAYVVKVHAPEPNPVSLYVMDTCPACDSDEIAEYGSMRRCRECGYQWQETEDDNDDR